MTRPPVISIQSAEKHFGHVAALDGVSIDIAEGEFFALLGPSGCGKTTLLRCIGGFTELDGGHILLDGEDLGNTKPYSRPTNMMFQSYAIFPHMKVRDNIAYGLKAERLPKAEIEERVEAILRLVDMLDLRDRRPHELSGGQRQRVALARALVKRPRVLLLDEPLAALDRKLRQEMQLELKRMQHEIGLTFIIVTHDQEEAMVVADRIAVMRAGKVLQIATPQELYRRPNDHFVASFIGAMNLYPFTTDGTTVRIEGIGVIPGLELPEHAMWVGFRPDVVRLVPADLPIGPGEVEVQGTVVSTAFVGSQIHIEISVDGASRPLIITTSSDVAMPGEGTACRVAFSVNDVIMLPDPPA